MANSAQARKRARQNISHRNCNMSLRSELRTAIKHVRKAIGSAAVRGIRLAGVVTIGAASYFVTLWLLGFRLKDFSRRAA